MDSELIVPFFPVHRPAVCAGPECHALGVPEFSTAASSSPSKQLLSPFRNAQPRGRRKILEEGTAFDGIPAFIAV